MATGFQVRCKSCPREIAHPPDSVGSSVQTWQSIGPGGFTGRSEQVELRNLSLSGISTYPTQWKGNSSSNNFSWDMLGSPRGWWYYLLLEWICSYSCLASLLMLLLQLLLITSKAFSPSLSGWLLCHGWTITPKKRSILGLTSLLSPSFTHSPSSNLHLFKNHLQVATKTTGRFTQKKPKDSFKIPRNIKVFKVAGHLSPLRPEIIFSEKHWIPKDPKQWQTMMLVSCLFRKVHGDVSLKHQGVTISY